MDLCACMLVGIWSRKVKRINSCGNIRVRKKLSVQGFGSDRVLLRLGFDSVL